MPQGGGAACKQVVLSGEMSTTEYAGAKLYRWLKEGVGTMVDGLIYLS